MSSYPAYAPQSPSSNIPYSNINAARTNAYPPHGRFDASAASLDSDSSSEDRDKPPSSKWDPAQRGHDGGGGPRVAVDVRTVNRTPSPTPSEAKELAKGVFDWSAMMK